jgi:hypothetical protein
MVAERLNQSYTVSGGEVWISVDPPVELGPGTYWVGLQARLDYLPGGSLALWLARTAQSNAGAAWRNPGDGWSTGCTTFQRRLDCLPQLTEPDQ